MAESRPIKLPENRETYWVGLDITFAATPTHPKAAVLTGEITPTIHSSNTKLKVGNGTLNFLFTNLAHNTTFKAYMMPAIGEEELFVKSVLIEQIQEALKDFLSPTNLVNVKFYLPNKPMKEHRVWTGAR